MVRDIFISYVNEDKSAADTICTNLENYGLQCWIAPRNIAPGEKYAPAIIHAIDNAKIVVVVFSHNSDQSAHVRTEIERAFNHEKMIIPFRIEDIEPSDEMQYFIGSRQWLDAFSGSLDGHTNRLADIIKKHLNVDPELRETQKNTISSHVKQFKITSDEEFPKKIEPSKFYQYFCRYISFIIDYSVGLVFGFFFFLAGIAIIGNQLNGTWFTSMLWLVGIFFWIIITDNFKIRSSGKALLGLKIYWPSDKMNSDKWRIIRSLIKNGPLLTCLLGVLLGSIDTNAGFLMVIIGIILYIVWGIPVLLTPKSQSIHDLVVGTVVYFR